MQKLATQVMIAGCGPVGLALANCLIRSSLIDSIVLLDRKVPSDIRQLPPLANQRVYSINGPSLKLLSNLKLLPLIRQKGIMSKVEVVSKQSLSFVNWSQNEANIIENDQLVYALMKGLKKQEEYAHKITYIQDEVTQFERNPQSCVVKLKSNQKQIQTKLLVGSDGNTSSIKRLAQIPHYGWPYRQKAIVCTMKIDHQTDNISAYQIYHDGNVFAILPLWDNYVSLVWSLGIPDFEYLMALPDNQFKNKMNNVIKNSNNHLRNQAGYIQIPQIIQIVNERLAFPLSTLQSGAYTQERVALVGDAAHSIHPMAGLGVNSGIMDSILLANNILRNLKTGNDIGDLIALGEYEAKAKVFNYENSLAMEAIKKTFQTDQCIVNKLRGIGMSIAQRSSFIKQAMKNAVDEKQLSYQWE